MTHRRAAGVVHLDGEDRGRPLGHFSYELDGVAETAFTVLPDRLLPAASARGVRRAALPRAFADRVRSQGTLPLDIGPQRVRARVVLAAVPVRSASWSSSSPSGIGVCTGLRRGPVRDRGPAQLDRRLVQDLLHAAGARLIPSTPSPGSGSIRRSRFRGRPATGSARAPRRRTPGIGPHRAPRGLDWQQRRARPPIGFAHATRRRPPFRRRSWRSCATRGPDHLRVELALPSDGWTDRLAGAHETADCARLPARGRGLYRGHRAARAADRPSSPGCRWPACSCSATGRR